MIAKIAVSAANFAIDKPYSYRIPEGMTLSPGVRVMVPFGRGNRRTEGVVLSVENSSAEDLKTVERQLDEAPVLTQYMLRLAAFLRERYFCTFYDAIRAILPAGLWYRAKDTYRLTEDRSWQEKSVRQEDALSILQFLLDCGGETTEEMLCGILPDDQARQKALQYLVRKKWVIDETDFLRRLGDKTEKIATLASSPEVAMEYAARLKKVPVSEEEYIRGYFEQYGVEIVTPKDKLINALKQGDYVIGIDYNPFVLQDVFHYENGMFEFLKFADIGQEIMVPLRLRREQSMLFPATMQPDFEAFLKGMSHYDDFIVSRKGNLLDIESIPPSMADLIQEKIKNKKNTDW